MDWWNLKAEHTPYEWEVQFAMYLVAPFGERRADMRAAHHTANLIASQAGKQIDEADYQAMVKSLMSYLMCDMESDSDEEDVSELALKRIKEQQ